MSNVDCIEQWFSTFLVGRSPKQARTYRGCGVSHPQPKILSANPQNFQFCWQIRVVLLLQSMTIESPLHLFPDTTVALNKALIAFIANLKGVLFKNFLGTSSPSTSLSAIICRVKSTMFGPVDTGAAGGIAPKYLTEFGYRSALHYT